MYPYRYSYTLISIRSSQMYIMLNSGYKLGFTMKFKNHKSYNYLTFVMKLKSLRKEMLRMSKVKANRGMILTSLSIFFWIIFKGDLVNTQNIKTRGMLSTFGAKFNGKEIHATSLCTEKSKINYSFDKKHWGRSNFFMWQLIELFFDIYVQFVYTFCLQIGKKERNFVKKKLQTITVHCVKYDKIRVFSEP